MNRCFDRFKKCVKANPKNMGECIRALNLCLRGCIPVLKQ
jgi:hypothetical protein